MATATELIRVLAEVSGLSETHIGIYARAAREAGLLSQGARGVHAAQMNFSDASNLLIAINASPLAKDVPETVQAFRSLEAESSLILEYDLGFHADWEAARKTRTFGDIFDRLLKSYCAPESADHPVLGPYKKLYGAADRKRAARHGVELPRPVLEIEFRSPDRMVFIRYRKAWIEQDRPFKFGMHVHDRARFGVSAVQDQWDRSTRVVITDRTLYRVAHLIAPPPAPDIPAPDAKRPRGATRRQQTPAQTGMEGV